MTIIRQYQNGNCTVTLYEDGTKVREYDGTPRPEFPESVDLKITEQCNQGCKHCHEDAALDGEHADLRECLRLVDGLPPGVEIAIGGGNPLAHPYFPQLTACLADKGLVVNVTSHLIHALEREQLLRVLRDRAILHGVGLSGAVSTDIVWQICPGLIDSNTVLHFVAGVDDPQDALRTACGKLLILGFKRRGRGEAVSEEMITKNLHAWRYWLRKICGQDGRSVSFDNLALEQLHVKDIVSDEEWNSHYMGDEGEFSLFVDAVKGEYAKSSVEEVRQKLNSDAICEAFVKLQESIGR